MNTYKWKITQGKRYIDSGTVEGETERDALEEVLTTHDGKLQADKSYSVTVGGSTMSSYGDEFGRSAGVTGWGSDSENVVLDGGHLFQPNLSDIIPDYDAAVDRLQNAYDKVLGVPKDVIDHANRSIGVGDHHCSENTTGYHSMNGTVVNPTTGMNHAQCRDCGFIEPFGLGTVGDFDRNREYRATRQCPATIDGFHSWNSVVNTDEQICCCGVSRNHPSDGQDTIIGHAMVDGQKGDVVRVRLAHGGPDVDRELGEKCRIGDGLRQGVSGKMYPPSRRKMATRDFIADKVFPDTRNDVEYVVNSDGDKPCTPVADALEKISVDPVRSPMSLPYPHLYKRPDLDGSVDVTLGEWKDPFTHDQLNSIRIICQNSGGVDYHLITGALRGKWAWKFTCSDGRYISISDEMVAQFRG